MKVGDLVKHKYGNIGIITRKSTMGKTRWFVSWVCREGRVIIKESDMEVISESR